MSRPIVFDVTHLVHRVAYDAPSGIDRVDLAYGRYFGLNPGRIAAAIHYGNIQPQVLPPTRAAEAVRRLEERWRETITLEGDPAFGAARQWLRGLPITKPPTSLSRVETIERKFRIGVLPFFRYAKAKKLTAPSGTVPEGAIYLNIAQHAMEHAEFFTWLRERRDIQRVFFLHDLLPLDHPEFWWTDHKALFERRVRVMAEHATALITSSQSVSDRARIEMAQYGKPNIPIFAHPLPSPIETDETASYFDPEISGLPYFVVVGTIEARKNHVLLLNVWRDLASRGGKVPKLVVIGKRGWENEQAVGLLERCTALESAVLEISGLSNAGLRSLIANARALLMPSFAEGYGLPLIEALSLGTPVVASDIPVFRETTQGKAMFLDPIDGLGWRDAIQQLADANSPRALAAREAAAAYVPQTTAKYFQAIETFLASL